MPLTAAERLALSSGAAALGVPLPPAAIEQIARYLDELRLWMSRINLVSRSDAAALVERHVVDSLAAAPLLATLPPDARIADVGSGAGLPGIPLGIALETRRFLLVEPRQKRASFLRAAARAVAGPAFEVCASRLQDLAAAGPVGALDAIVTRAALESAELLEGTEPLLRPGGIAIAYRSAETARGEGPRAGFAGPTLHPYRTSPGGTERFLVTWRRVSADPAAAG